MLWPPGREELRPKSHTYAASVLEMQRTLDTIALYRAWAQLVCCSITGVKHIHTLQSPLYYGACCCFFFTLETATMTMWSAFVFQHLRVVEYDSREVPCLVTVESDTVRACSGKVWMRCGSNRVWDHLFKWTRARFTIWAWRACVHTHQINWLLESTAPGSGPLAWKHSLLCGALILICVVTKSTLWFCT